MALEVNLVDYSSSPYATGWNMIEKNFHYQNLYWIFYSDGTNLAYKTYNGTSLSSKNTITTCDTGVDFGIWFNGSFLHYAKVNAYDPIKYRMGKPLSNGSISWNTTEQTAYNPSGACYNPSISVDSSGYPFILYSEAGAFDQEKVVALKSDLNNGTWTTSSGFPQDLTALGGEKFIKIVPLTNQKMYAIYTQLNDPVKGKLWNTTDFENEETISSGDTEAMFDATTNNDVIDLVFEQNGVIKHKKRNGSWGSETELGNVDHGVAITRNNNDLMIFYFKDDILYYKAFANNSWLNSMNLLTYSNAEVYSLNSFIQKYAVTFTEDAVSQCDVNFLKFDSNCSINSFNIVNENGLPVYDVEYWDLEGLLKFKTQGNVTVMGIVETPQWITDNDTYITWNINYSSQNLTLTNLNGEVIKFQWEIIIPPGTQGVEPEAEIPVEEEKKKPVFELPKIGLYAIFLSMGIVAVGGILASKKQVKVKRRIKGSTVKPSKKPRGYSGKMRKARKWKR